MHYAPNRTIAGDITYMPTYLYHCDNCQEDFEAVRRYTDPPLTICPNGHEGTIKKLFVPAGIVFKGSGWYSTDSRSTSNGKSKNDKGESGEKADKGDKGDKAEAKSDAPTEAKSESKSDSGKGDSSKGESAGKSETSTKSESKAESTAG